MQGPEPIGVVAVFRDHAHAHDALEAFEEAGWDMRSVSIFGRRHEGDDVPPELDRGALHRKEVAAFWARWGAMTGATAGAGAIGIPLLAFLVGAGPFALMLGAAAGAAALSAGAGALVGALIGAGIHEKHAREYERALAAGKYLVVVHADSAEDVAEAREIAGHEGAERVDVHGEIPL